VWQQLQEELAPHGLAIIAVAIDSDVEALREWAAHAPGLTVVVDRDYVVAERYGIVNVPATVWIDEAGNIVRPADTAMGDDRFRAFAHIDSAVHHELLRRWVTTGERDLDDAAVAPAGEEGPGQFLPRSGVAGVAAAADHHPDLVLLDLGLADLGGAEVLRRIRATARPRDRATGSAGHDRQRLRRPISAPRAHRGRSNRFSAQAVVGRSAVRRARRAADVLP